MPTEGGIFGWIDFIMHFLTEASNHFLLAFALGFLGFFWMRIICSVLYSVMLRLTRRKASTAAVFFTIYLPLLLGLALALLSHSWLDGFSIWWKTPLGPPLDPMGAFNG
jgi:hypothetical protein